MFECYSYHGICNRRADNKRLSFSNQTVVQYSVKTYMPMIQSTYQWYL